MPKPTYKAGEDARGHVTPDELGVGDRVFVKNIGDAEIVIAHRGRLDVQLATGRHRNVPRSDIVFLCPDEGPPYVVRAGQNGITTEPTRGRYDFTL